MYFPSPLPTTRLSLSTSFLPTGPSPPAKTQVYKTPGRPSRGKFKGALGGVQEEEGEEVLAIVRGPAVESEANSDGVGRTLWAALGREEVSVWSTRVRRGPIFPSECPADSRFSAESRPCQTSTHSPFLAHTRRQCFRNLSRLSADRRDYHRWPPPPI